MPKLAALALLPGLFAAAAQGQTASLVRDINPVGSGIGGSPSALYAAPGRLFFFGGVGGTGIWASDGTASGTVLLADLCPDSACGSAPDSFLGDVGGTVLWAAKSEDLILRLWRSDGTRPGTYPLTGPGTGIAPPSLDSDPGRRSHAFFQGLFHFRACDAGGCKSYRSDGSAAGTAEIPPLGDDLVPVGDLLFSLARDEITGRHVLQVTRDAAAGSAVLARFPPTYRPDRLTAAGGKLFFLASEGAQGQELWVSDGSEAGTLALTGFGPPRPFPDFQAWLKPAGNRVYFVAADKARGEELWVSDGTSPGTRRVTSFRQSAPFSQSSGAMEEVGGRFVFVAIEGTRPGLWSTTGVPGSAVRLPGNVPSAALTLKRSGGRLFFLAADPQHGTELWSTDGTPAGTGLVADVCPGPCSSLTRDEQILAWPGGVFLVGADDGVHGREIWLSDGTGAGTRRITEIADPSADHELFFTAPVSFAGKVWFGTGSFLGPGGLWSTDGAPESTRLVAHPGRLQPLSNPRDLTVAGGRLYFAADDGVADGLWSTLGSPESTLLVQATDDRPSSFGGIQAVAAAGGLVFFWRYATPDFEVEEQLWRTDGTPEGTFQLRSDRDFAFLGTTRGVAFHDRIYFVERSELWVSDGTAAGTGVFFSHPHPLGSVSVAGGALYFATPGELWTSDGTAAGTRRLVAISAASSFVASGGLVFFIGAGSRLWTTDGTPEGTREVADLPISRPTNLIPFQGGLAFFAGFEDGHALWLSDGTAAGTVAVRKFAIGDFGQGAPHGLTALGDRLFFKAWDEAHGSELWVSDGTAAGTRMVRDIAPGWRSSSPRGLTAAGGRLFFTAGDGVHGSELWVSDGTAAGTRMVQDLNPYASSSEPERLTAVGERLYFTADDGITGRELWSYPLNAGPGCQPTSARLCLGQGRFQVEAAWRDFEGRRGTGKAVALTADTGWFWFFDPANVEAVLKMLDGRGVNQHHWVFYGALSSVEYYLTVTDTQTGAARRYYNPPGQLASVGDTQGFGPLGAFSRKGKPEGLAPLTRIATRLDPAAATGSCQPTAERLCLNGGRFAVEVSWKDFQGNEGTGKAVDLTADTGWFWFFSDSNVEVMVKVLDGTGLNGKHWVFYGALSNVEYTLTVTDTHTGQQNTYRNLLGQFASVADTGAF